MSVMHWIVLDETWLLWSRIKTCLNNVNRAMLLTVCRLFRFCFDYLSTLSHFHL